MSKLFERMLILSIALISIVSLVGWYLKLPILFTWHYKYVPMQANTAVSFLIALFSSVFITTRKSYLFALVLIGFSFLVLLQDIFSVSFNLDTLFFEPFYTLKVVNPGRMAPNTSVCFLCYGIFLILNRNMKLSAFLLGVVHGTGLATLIGYFFDLTLAYDWFYKTGMSLPTALGFTFLSMLGFLSLLPRNSLYRWVPIAVGTVGIIKYTILSTALYQDEPPQIASIVLFYGLLASLCMVVGAFLFVLKKKSDLELASIYKKMEDLQHE